MLSSETDTARFGLIREVLHTAVIGDVLDSVGREHQFLDPSIRALSPSMKLVGRAMPVLIGDVFGPQKQPFGRLTEALDALQPGEVYLARGGRIACAAWGEILTATARTRGASGAVLDGYHRDTRRILQQDWPVFSRGSYGQDAAVRSSVLDYRVPVTIHGVSIRPGDLVVGDVDGVVVVPHELEAEVLELALAKVSTEKDVLHAVETGLTATEALAQFGVL